MNSLQRLHRLHSLLTVLIARNSISRSNVLDVNCVLRMVNRTCSNLVTNQTDTDKETKVDYADYFKKLGLQLHDQIVSDAKDREPSNSEQFRTINSKPRNSIPLTSSSIGLVNQLNKEKERDDRFHVPSGDPLPDVTRLNDESLPSMIKDENDIEVSNVKLNDYEDNSVNPLEKGHVTLDDVPTTFPLSFNLAAYVVKSSTLQKLVDLGVDLAKWDTMKDVPSFIAKLDFEKDMKPHIQFLHDVGVPTEALGKFLTKTPLIFKCDLDDLQVRINYLQSKKFTEEAIARIVTKASHFLMFSTNEIDRRLGFFQNEFHLSGDEVRSVVTRFPKLVLHNMQKINEKQFSLKEEMGFKPNELKILLLAKPKLWLLERRSLVERFQLIHNEMEIPHNLILQFPGCLLKRRFAVKQRHLYLKALNRAQYDPKKEGYVSLKAIVSGSDADFCAETAKTSLKQFNDFLKTL